MNDIQMQLDSIVDSYYEDLINTDISDVKGHKYSKKYKERIHEAFAVFDINSKLKARNIRRRVIIALIVAALIGTITAAAYDPAKMFFMRFFSDHTEIIPAEDSLAIDTHKTSIEKKYTITVPAGYVLDKESSIETENMLIQTYYYETDRTISIVFEQKIKSAFGINVDNGYTDLITEYDRNGQEILVQNANDKFIILIWDNGEYVFDLSGELTKSELMEIYYKIK